MRNRGHNKKLLSILASVTYLLMVVTNIAANLIPLKGMTTRRISDKYSNLFAPAGYTFLIWFLIYFLLGMYILYQHQFNNRRPDNNDRVVRLVNLYFILANLVNVLWVVLWHYEMIGLSLVAIIVLWIILLIIRTIITNRTSMSKREKQSIELPFSVYFGWVTVAVMANFGTYFTYAGKIPFGFDDVKITVFLVIAASVLIGVNLVRFRDIAIGIIGLWALIGVIVRQIIVLDSFNTSVVISCGLGVGIVLVAAVYVLLGLRKRKRSRRR